MQQKLPEYTYVPGVTPHPISHPQGHWRQRPELTSEVEGLLEWGLRLFNHGYYWEAHEIWEAAWVRLGRTGLDADFVKGFIKLAACGVKCLEGNQAGARRHARRVGELLRKSDQVSAALRGMPGAVAMEIAAACEHSPPLADDNQRSLACHGGVTVLPKLT